MGEGLLQPMHLLVIAGLALLVFGPKKLPELGKGLGEAIRGFKSSLDRGWASRVGPRQRDEEIVGPDSMPTPRLQRVAGASAQSPRAFRGY